LAVLSSIVTDWQCGSEVPQKAVKPLFGGLRSLWRDSVFLSSKVEFCVDDRLFFVTFTGPHDCSYVRGFGG